MWQHKTRPVGSAARGRSCWRECGCPASSFPATEIVGVPLFSRCFLVALTVTCRAMHTQRRDRTGRERHDCHPHRRMMAVAAPPHPASAANGGTGYEDLLVYFVLKRCRSEEHTSELQSLK